jgi:hypothetical protein
MSQRDEDDDHPSVIEPGVYRRRTQSGGYSLQIHLNTANETSGNGINLMPARSLLEPESGRLSLVITEAAFKRIVAAIQRAE